MCVCVCVCKLMLSLKQNGFILKEEIRRRYLVETLSSQLGLQNIPTASPLRNKTPQRMS